MLTRGESFIVLLSAGFIVATIVWFLYDWVTRRKRDPAGFEVKLPTGETPVLKQKENDHG